jgi:hypothetical protein
MPGRDPTQCGQHWKKVLEPSYVKGFWAKDEDALLLTLKAKESRSWGEIAEQIDGRTPKQCRERWNTSLDPKLKRSAFSVEEDRILIDEWKDVGPRWTVIARALPGRTQTKIRDRFKTLRIKFHTELNEWERSQQPRMEHSETDRVGEMSGSDCENQVQNAENSESPALLQPEIKEGGSYSRTERRARYGLHAAAVKPTVLEDISQIKPEAPFLDWLFDPEREQTETAFNRHDPSLRSLKDMIRPEAHDSFTSASLAICNMNFEGAIW